MWKPRGFGRYHALERKHVIGLKVVLILGFVVLAASDGGNVILTEKDQGGRVGVAKGGSLYVRLEASPGTGYGWEIAKNDSRILKLIGKPTFEKSENSQPGGPETEVFHFEGRSTGTTTLELHYRRPWEKDVPPAKTFHVEIEVH